MRESSWFKKSCTPSYELSMVVVLEEIHGWFLKTLKMHTQFLKLAKCVI